jgi:cell division transport system ATP-binding protein
MTATLERPLTAATDARDPVISMVDVGMTYPNGKVALNDVNVTIPAGDFVFLVGPSGAGKSTFIRLLIREQLPTAGRVVVAGRDLARMRRGDVHKLRRRIGIVFQDFRLLPQKTVFENVAFALEVTGATRAEVRRRVPMLLNLVGLHEHDNHLPTQLSGGEQQRVALARAFAARPPILLADEPTGNLDSENGAMILEMMTALQREHATTLVIVTHDLAITKRVDRTIHLRDGRVVGDERAGVAAPAGVAAEREPA